MVHLWWEKSFFLHKYTIISLHFTERETSTLKWLNNLPKVTKLKWSRLDTPSESGWESMLLTTSFRYLLCWSKSANWFISCWFSEEGGTETTQSWKLGSEPTSLGKGGSCKPGILKDTSASPLTRTDMPRAESQDLWPRSATSGWLSSMEAGELSAGPGQRSSWRVGWSAWELYQELTLKEQGLPSLFIKEGKKKKKGKALTRANMEEFLPRYSIRTSCSMKWQMKGGVGMECHKPDEKPQGGRKHVFSPSSSSHSSSSSALKCPPPRTEVNKVMGEAHHPTGYIPWLSYLQTHSDDR